MVTEGELPYWHLEHEVLLAEAEANVGDGAVEEAGGSKHQHQVKVPGEGGLQGRRSGELGCQRSPWKTGVIGGIVILLYKDFKDSVRFEVQHFPSILHLFFIELIYFYNLYFAIKSKSINRNHHCKPICIYNGSPFLGLFLVYCLQNYATPQL